MILPTLGRFPTSSAVKEASALVWGCTVTPFASAGATENDARLVTINPDVPIVRCSECFAYINPLCRVRVRWWSCGLCGHRNHVSPGSSARIRTNGPELTNSLVEYVIPLESKAIALAATDPLNDDKSQPCSDSQATKFEVPAEQQPPLFVALVDETADAITLAAVSSALEAFVASAPEEACFALVTFSDRLGLFDLHGCAPAVPTKTGGPSTTAKAVGGTPPHVTYTPIGRVELPDKHAEACGALPSFKEDFPACEKRSGHCDEHVPLGEILELDEFVVPLDASGRAAARAALRSLADESAHRASERTAPAQCLGLALGRILKLLLGSSSCLAQRVEN